MVHCLYTAVGEYSTWCWLILYSIQMNGMKLVMRKFRDLFDSLTVRLLPKWQDSDLIPRLLEMVEFWNFFLANLFSIKKEAYTKILRLVGVCVGEFFTKNTLKLYIGQSTLKNGFF